MPARPPNARTVASGTWIFLAMAAVLLSAIGLLVVPRGPERAGAPLRSAVDAPIESRVTEGALPRDRFLLQWTPGPAGSTYAVSVSDEQGRALQGARDLQQPEFTVPAASLSALPSNSRLFWRVDARLPDGRTLTSKSFVVILR